VSRRERLLSWLVPAALVPLVLLQLGYMYGAILHPWIYHRIDPAWLANDWFTTTLPHHLNAIGFVAAAARWVSPPATVLVLHLAALFLLLWVSYRTSRLLADHWGVFYIAVFLFLRWGTGGLGGNGLWGNFLVPHNATVPVCLLAFYLALRDRLAAAALVAAAATWMHVQLGAQTMLVLGLGLALDLRRAGLRRLSLAAALYAAAVAPTLISQWRLYLGGPSPLSTEQFVYLNAVLRQPHHVAPFSWDGAEYYRLGLVLLMAALARPWRHAAGRRILAWFGVIVALCVVGTVFVEIVPTKLGVKLQLFRVTVFVKFFAVLYAARWLLDLWQERGVAKKIGALAILAIPNFALVGITLALVAAAGQARRWAWGLAVFAAGTLAGVTTVATASLGRPIPMFWHSFAVPLPAARWDAALWVALAAAAWRFPRVLPLAPLGLLAVQQALTGAVAFNYDHLPRDGWQQFGLQVKALTPRDAVFITPPHLEGFQLFAERAHVGDFKCFPFREADMLEWKSRLDDLAGAELRCGGFVDCASQLAYGYSRLREPDFLRLGRKYGARYVVTTHREQPLHFPERARLEEFVLYELPVQPSP